MPIACMKRREKFREPYLREDTRFFPQQITIKYEVDRMGYHALFQVIYVDWAALPVYLPGSNSRYRQRRGTNTLCIAMIRVQTCFLMYQQTWLFPNEILRKSPRLHKRNKSTLRPHYLCVYLVNQHQHLLYFFLVCLRHTSHYRRRFHFVGFPSRHATSLSLQNRNEHCITFTLWPVAVVVVVTIIHTMFIWWTPRYVAQVTYQCRRRHDLLDSYPNVIFKELHIEQNQFNVLLIFSFCAFTTLPVVCLLIHTGTLDHKKVLFSHVDGW